MTASVLPEDLQAPEELSRRNIRKQLLFLTGVVLVRRESAEIAVCAPQTEIEVIGLGRVVIGPASTAPPQL